MYMSKDHFSDNWIRVVLMMADAFDVNDDHLNFWTQVFLNAFHFPEKSDLSEVVDSAKSDQQPHFSFFGVFQIANESNKITDDVLFAEYQAFLKKLEANKPIEAAWYFYRIGRRIDFLVKKNGKQFPKIPLLNEKAFNHNVIAMPQK